MCPWTTPPTRPSRMTTMLSKTATPLTRFWSGVQTPLWLEAWSSEWIRKANGNPRTLGHPSQPSCRGLKPPSLSTSARTRFSSMSLTWKPVHGQPSLGGLIPALSSLPDGKMEQLRQVVDASLACVFSSSSGAMFFRWSDGKALHVKQPPKFCGLTQGLHVALTSV